MKGEYASKVNFLGSSQVIPDALLPLIKVRGWVSKMIKDSGHSQTVKVVRREDICAHSKELSYKTLLLSVRIRIYKRMYLQMHLLGVMFHSGPV